MNVVQNFVTISLLVLVTACQGNPTQGPIAKKEPAPAPQPDKKLGAPIAQTETEVSLKDLAANSKNYVGKNIVTRGRVEKVCQHMGCWMTLRDENGEAYIRMAGHAFAVPKDAPGKTARIAAKLVEAEEPAPMCGAHGENKQGCKAEAEKAVGKPLAKLELEATGVELFQ
jgi:hypothetical protein